MSALSTSGLGKHFGGPWVIRDCEVRIPDGKVVGLVGSNGAGKSTLLSLAAGLTAPSVGTLRVFGTEVRGRIHPDAALLAQHRPLYSDFTVGEMVRAAAKMNERWSAERVEQVLVTHPGLNRDARVGSLSKGMRTLLALALALGRQPKLLLLDEVLSDLDVPAREDVLKLVMSDVAERGATVLMASHAFSDLRDVCDHLVLMHAGRVLLDGDVEQLLDQHRELLGPAGEVPAAGAVIRTSVTARQQRALVRAPGPAAEGWAARRPALDALVADYLRAGRSTP